MIDVDALEQLIAGYHELGMAPPIGEADTDALQEAIARARDTHKRSAPRA